MTVGPLERGVRLAVALLLVVGVDLVALAAVLAGAGPDPTAIAAFDALDLSAPPFVPAGRPGRAVEADHPSVDPRFDPRLPGPGGAIP